MNIHFIYFLNILSFFINLLYVNNSTYEEVIMSWRELAYSYYMRGKYIQYNNGKVTLFFSPEEATKQNNNFLFALQLQ